MLFQVTMDVRIPHDANPAKVDVLKRDEKARALELQRAGTWRHLWRVVGHYKNVSIFDVRDAAELHGILSTLPLFPFMDMEVVALCRHPSALHEDDT